MKLHLPVVLLSALFAVLSASRSSAEVTFTYDPKEEAPEAPAIQNSYGTGLLDGIIQNGYYQDVTLIIEKDDSEGEVCVKVAPEENDHGSVFFIGDHNQITVGSGCALEICRGQYGAGTFLGYTPYVGEATGQTIIDLSGELRWSDSYPDTAPNTQPDLFCSAKGTLTGIIKIHQGGRLNCAREDGKTLTLSRASASTDPSEVIASIEVEKGGEFLAGSVIVGEAQAHLLAQTTCTATTKLTLKGGLYNGECSGADTLGRGAQNPIYSPGKDILTTTIQIESGGEYRGGDLSRIADTSAVDNETSTVLINVVGENSKFTTKGDIGIVSKGTSSGVTINVTNGGQFVLHSKTTGDAATVNTSEVPDQVGECSTIITVSDAVFAIEGAATIGMKEVSEASITICGDSTFKLNYTDEETKPTAIYADVVMEGGKLELSNKALTSDYQKAAFQRGVFVRSAVSDTPITVDLGGLDASLVNQIQLTNAGDRVIGLMKGTTLILHEGDVLAVGEESWKKGDEEKDTTAMLQFNGGNSNVTVDGDSSVLLDLDQVLIALAEEKDGSDVSLEVSITNGTLSGWEGDDASAWLKDHFHLAAGSGLHIDSWSASSGNLLISGNIVDVWVSTAHDEGHSGTASANMSDLEGYKKVIVNEETTLTADTDGTIFQLSGSPGADLTIKGAEGIEKATTVTLHNQDKDEPGDGKTSFSGNITAGDNVNLKKTGDADLTVNGNLKAAGDVTVEEGKLAIGGNDSSIDGTLSLGKKGASEEEAGTSGELQVDGKLTLSQDQDLTDSQGSITGSGTVVLDGDFTVGGDVKLGEELTFQMGEKAANADFGNNAVTLQDLEGKKDVTAKRGVTLTGEGTFSGAITGDTTVQGEYTLSGATINGTLDNGGTNADSTVILSEEGVTTVGNNLVLRKGATTRVKLDFGKDELWEGDSREAFILNATGNIIVEAGTIFEIENLSDVLSSNLGKGEKEVFLMKGQHVFSTDKHYETGAELEDNANSISGECDTKAKIQLDHELNWFFKNAYIVFHNDEAAASQEEAIMLTAEEAERPDSPYIALRVESRSGEDINKVAESSNAIAGSSLLTHYTEEKLPSEIAPDVLQVISYLGDVIDSNPAEANRIMSAVAGSTLTSLSAAQSAALRNQESRVRDHALQAARLRCMGNDEATAQQRPCKTTHVWVEGTSFFSEQHSRGDESGYRLNSWGGAVGIDAQVDAHWSVGLSLAANYGDLEARAADYAKGDLDSYYVSAWSQAKNGRWGNTLLATVGTNEGDLRRTVNYGSGSYTATSSTSGSSLGAMWELTYDLYPVKDNKSNIIQPLFNVAVQHTSMDGFSEKNAGNVGLTTEKQTRDTVTLGLGLRWLAAINSAKAVNRTVSTEVHANVAQDMGDRRSVANVALLADPSYTQNVYGSKAGSTAFQFGAGVNVPMTPNSQIYVNAGGELREHANAWNAALGVRMGF